jgi:hypothetical protein
VFCNEQPRPARRIASHAKDETLACRRTPAHEQKLCNVAPLLPKYVVKQPDPAPRIRGIRVIRVIRAAVQKLRDGNALAVSNLRGSPQQTSTRGV